MKEVSSEVVIAADPKKIWNILVDLESWSDWNPTAKQIVGKPTLGAKVQITFACESKNHGNKFSAEILDVKECERLSWRAVMGIPFLFVSDRIVELYNTDKGTRVIFRETGGGVFAWLFWEKMKGDMQSILDSTGRALKVKVENLK